jgi:hypothetical protein
MGSYIFNDATKLTEIHLEWITPPPSSIDANAFVNINAAPTPTTFYVKSYEIYD